MPLSWRRCLEALLRGTSARDVKPCHPACNRPWNRRPHYRSNSRRPSQRTRGPAPRQLAALRLTPRQSAAGRCCSTGGMVQGVGARMREAQQQLPRLPPPAPCPLPPPPAAPTHSHAAAAAAAASGTAEHPLRGQGPAAPCTHRCLQPAGRPTLASSNPSSPALQTPSPSSRRTRCHTSRA